MEKLHVFTADVDSTLRGLQSEIPGPQTIRAFEKMHSEGWLIGIESGRPLWQEMEEHHKQWNLSFQFDFIIGLNGGELHDYLTNDISTYNLLSCESIRKVVEGILPFGVNPFIYRDGYMMSLYDDDRMEHSSLKHHSPLRICKEVKEIYEIPTAKILIRTDRMKDPDGFEKYCLENICDENITCFKTTPIMLEFQSPLNSKGTALQTFCQRHHISRNSIIAFGDSENDIPMLKYAGTSVALENALDVVKKVSDYTTEYSVDDDGVGRFLFQHIL